MTDRQTEATTTLKTLARLRAENLRGGSDNFDIAHGPQLAVALRASGITEEGWQILCTQAEAEEAEQWEQKLIDANEAAIERRRETRRPQ